MIALLIVAGFLWLAAFFTLGLPGGVMAWLATLAVELIRGWEPNSLMTSDRALGLAIILSIVGPPGIPIVYGLVLRFTRLHWLPRTLLTIALVYLAWVLTVLVVTAL